MPAKPIRTLDVRTRKKWRAWLERNHAKVGEIWLVMHKKHTGIVGVEHADALDEALCFGWIDSLVRRLDEDRYAIKFTPRKPDSVWSAPNRRRYADLKKRGLLAAPGIARAPTGRTAKRPAPYALTRVPAYIESALKAERPAWATFEGFTAEQKRRHVGWIDTAKREETKARRLTECVRLLARGEKLGLK